MRKIQIAVIVAVAMLTLSLTASAIDLQQAQSTFYSSGGTQLTCFGLACGSSTGDTSGVALFSLTSLVSYDGSSTTFSYWLTNTGNWINTGGTTPVPFDLESLAIGAPSGVVVTSSSPQGATNWNAVGAWTWLCGTFDNPCGLSGGQTVPGSSDPAFSMTVAGLVMPQLQEVWVGVGPNPTGASQPFIVTMPDWQAEGAGQVVPTPEPASMLLLASGLLGGAVYKRRRK